MKVQNCNIAIILPSEISKKVIKISRNLKEEGAIFTLDSKNYFPHITLYLTGFPVKNIRRVEKALEEISSSTTQFELPYRENANSWYGFVEGDFKKTKKIYDLHKTVMEKLNPLREGYIRKKDMERMKKFPKEVQDNLRRYGYHTADELYIPHITYTKLKDETKDVLDLIPNEDLSFTVSKIGLFESGDHGTCKKLIKEFTLAK